MLGNCIHNTHYLLPCQDSRSWYSTGVPNQLVMTSLPSKCWRIYFYLAFNTFPGLFLNSKIWTQNLYFSLKLSKPKQLDNSTESKGNRLIQYQSMGPLPPPSVTQAMHAIIATPHPRSRPLVELSIPCGRYLESTHKSLIIR